MEIWMAIDQLVVNRKTEKQVEILRMVAARSIERVKLLVNRVYRIIRGEEL